MQKKLNKSEIAIALFLVSSFAISMIAVFPASAQVTKVPDRETGAYLSVNPPVIGINQELLVNLWVYPPPQGPQFEMGTAITGLADPTHQYYGLHFANITATFTRPDGSKDTFMPLDGSAGPLGLVAGMTEEIGAIWFFYKPTQLGTWSVSFSFPGQTYTALNYSVYYKPSTSQTVTFTVQQDNVLIGLPPVQLPTGYWERPISADNREWSEISGDWVGVLNSESSMVSGVPGARYGYFNPYTKAPNSAHILWTNEVSLGGLAGGEWGGVSYADGGGSPSIIIDGKVYYIIAAASGTETRCVDLRTGKTVWQLPISITVGQIAAPSATSTAEFAGSPVPYLWSFSSTGWRTYDAWSGALVRNITNIPPSLGTPSFADANIVFVLRQGTWNPISQRRPFNELIKWNMSKVTGNNWLTGVVWNVSLKQPGGAGPGEGSRGSSIRILPDESVAVVRTMGEDMHYGYDMNTGAKLWAQSAGFTVQIQGWTQDGDLIAYDVATMKLHLFDVSSTGMKELWVAQVGEYPWGSQSMPRLSAYGNIYNAAFDGHMTAIDQKTGEIKWDFYTGNTTETPFGSWAIFIVPFVADGKVYFATSEHTPTQPRIRGNRLFCVDAYTGKGLWNISFAASFGAPLQVADGYLLARSEIVGLLYCFGKGQTSTTVAASPKVSVHGSSVLVEGSVLDLSPASAGTAAISDEDMSGWMDYLHMQKPLPNHEDVKGVEVSLDTVDPNNNFVHIATVTSDSSGLYSYKWKPEVPGKYTVIATFAGSESYWASYAETAVSVDEAPVVTPPAEQVQTDFTPMYAALAGGVIAIIIAIAIAVVLILRKKP